MLQYKIKIKKKKTHTLEPKKTKPTKKPEAKQNHKTLYHRNIRPKFGQRSCQNPPVLPFPSCCC